MNNRLLLVQDDPSIGAMLAACLRHEGYAIDVFASNDEGLETAILDGSDVIILDVTLPHKQGFEICAWLRRKGIRKPVLMLTARCNPCDVLTGLRLGADDCLTKPFDMVELMARLEALERRAQSGPAGAPAACFRLGEVQVDLLKKMVTRGGSPVLLSSREFALLEFFITHPGVVWSRDELLQRVWRFHRLPYTRTVDVHISQLRQKLEWDANVGSYIVTVPCEGYRFEFPHGQAD